MMHWAEQDFRTSVTWTGTRAGYWRGRQAWGADRPLFFELGCLERVGFSKSRRQWEPNRAVSNDLLSGPWVRTVAAYAGVATVSPASLVQAENGAAGHKQPYS